MWIGCWILGVSVRCVRNSVMIRYVAIPEICFEM